MPATSTACSTPNDWPGLPARWTPTTRATPQVALAGRDTIFLATGDGDGNLVSLIESNYMGFGSGLVDPQTGISYQNRAFFSLDPDHANALVPSKRTMHTLTPGMLLRDGKPWIAHGSMGGEIQPQVFMVVSAIVDGGADIATALALPRWPPTTTATVVHRSRRHFESRFGREVGRELERLGQGGLGGRLRLQLGHANAIELAPSDNGEITLAAATDPRTEGAALAVNGLVYSEPAGRAALTTRAVGHPLQAAQR